MSQMRLKMMDGRKNNMKFAKCEYGTLLSDWNLYTHYKIIHKLKNSQITEAARHLEFKPINNSNNNNPNPNNNPINNNNGGNSSTSTNTTSVNEEFYQKRQEYWDKREKIIVERWEETKKWEQDRLSCIRLLREISQFCIYIKDKTIVTAQQKRGMRRSEKRYMKIEKV